MPQSNIPNNKDLNAILRNTYKLKGVSYIIHKDFSGEIWKNKSALFELKSEIY